MREDYRDLECSPRYAWRQKGSLPARVDADVIPVAGVNGAQEWQPKEMDGAGKDTRNAERRRERGGGGEAG